MTTTQLIPNDYRLKNAISFVNSFSPVLNVLSASITGTVNNNDANISSITSNSGISVGQIITANVTGIPTGTTVVAVGSSNITMSAAFTGSTSTAIVNTYQTTTSGYYIFAGQSSSWAAGVVPQYYDNPSTLLFNAYDNMLFGKSITSSDVSLMIPAVQWQSGITYSMYDDANPNLSNENFYVYTTDNVPSTYYYVFKCLNNNGETPSTYAPNYNDTSAIDNFFQTADGYQWKYMYSFPSSLYNKFATNLYIPVVPDSNVTSNAVSGTIDVIAPVDSNNNIVPYTGQGYINYYSGILSGTTSGIGGFNNTLTPRVHLDIGASTQPNLYNGCYFYITGGTGQGQYSTITSHLTYATGTYINLASNFAITPDGTSTYMIAPAVNIYSNGDYVTNAAAMALVNSTPGSGNSIYGVQILNTGINVYSATANVYVYGGYSSSISNVATLRVIGSPKRGHGANVASELYSNTVCISVTFANSESNTIPAVNQYQSVGILSNPLFSNVVFNVSSQTGNFNVGETVTQSIGNINSSGIVTSAVFNSNLQITNATGTFVISNTALVTGSSSGTTAQITGIQNNGVVKGFKTFNQLYSYNGTYTSGITFNTNETVTQGTSTAVFHSNNSTGTIVYLTSKLGPITTGNIIGNSGTIFNINTINNPDLIPESGDVIYIENFNAIARSNTQSETVKLLFSF